MSSSWTEWQNGLFEKALVRYDKDTPDRWQNVARAVGCGKSAEDVKRHFAELYQDLGDIEAGDLRQFGGSGNTKGASSSGGSSKERRQ